MQWACLERAEPHDDVVKSRRFSECGLHAVGAAADRGENFRLSFLGFAYVAEVGCQFAHSDFGGECTIADGLCCRCGLRSRQVPCRCLPVLQLVVVQIAGPAVRRGLGLGGPDSCLGLFAPPWCGGLVALLPVGAWSLALVSAPKTVLRDVSDAQKCPQDFEAACHRRRGNLWARRLAEQERMCEELKP